MSKSNRHWIFSNPMLFNPIETNEHFKGIVDVVEGYRGKQRGDLIICSVRRHEGEIQVSTGERIMVHSWVVHSIYRWDGSWWEHIFPNTFGGGFRTPHHELDRSSDATTTPIPHKVVEIDAHRVAFWCVVCGREIRAEKGVTLRCSFQGCQKEYSVTSEGKVFPCGETEPLE